MGHAEDEAPERLAIDPLAQLGHQTEHPHRLRGIFRKSRGLTLVPPRTAQLRLYPPRPLSRAGVGRRAGRSRYDRPVGAERLVQFGGVLAEVQPHDAEAKQLHLAADRPHEIHREGRPRGLGQPPLHRAEIAHELFGGRVPALLGLEPVVLRGHERGVEPAQHAGKKLAEHFAGVAIGDADAVAAGGE